MARLTRLILAAAVFTLSGLLFGAGPATATALPIGQCTTSSGVILAVDFSHWGGPLLRSCGSVPTTGHQLLTQGGWATTGTQHDGPAFICRIGYSGYQGGTQYPTTATEACVKTPPATAYWSYWHAKPGENTWSYSQLGAMNYQPVNGSVDLWIFGGTNVAGTSGTPQFTPDSVRAHNTSPTGGVVAPGTSSAPVLSKPNVPPASTSPNSSAAGSDSGMHRGSTASSTVRTSAAKPSSSSAKPQVAASGTSSPAGATTSASGSVPKIVDAEPAAQVEHSSGSYVPELVAGVVVLALGGAAGLTSWRRRRAG